MDSTTIAGADDATQCPRPTWRERWFHGLGRTGFIIVAIAASINAVRRNINFVLADSFDEWLMAVLETFATGLMIGTAILLAAIWAVNRVARRGPRQYATVAIAMVIASIAGVLAQDAWETDGTFRFGDPDMSLGQVAMFYGIGWLRYSLLGLLIAGAWLYVREEGENAAALAQCTIDSARMDEQTAEARLQMLQAQIEPHFLFNTLAHIKRLYETDLTSGKEMLSNLMAYLAVALPQFREAESTLGREIDHAVAYLNIQKVRMGRRLAIDVDVPEALRGARMPPLMILTLVENAIKHGLGPLPEGGRIVLRASIQEGRLKVQVVDTGQGFAKSSGGGTGLANVRARLAALFEESASLSIALNASRGVAATIVVPYRAISPAGGSA